MSILVFFRGVVKLIYIYIWDAGMPRSPEQMAEGSKVWTCCKTKEKSHPFDEIQQHHVGISKRKWG